MAARKQVQLTCDLHLNEYCKTRTSYQQLALPVEFSILICLWEDPEIGLLLITSPDWNVL
jgi:hypothetical protein